MGTNNFAVQNAGKYYAVLMNREEPVLDDDGEETEETETVAPDEFEVDCYFDILTERMETVAKELRKRLPNKCEVNVWEDDYSGKERNFNLRSKVKLNVTRYYHDVAIEMQYAVGLRGAYYEGATLDWDFIGYIGGHGGHDDTSCMGEDWLDTAEWRGSAPNLSRSKLHEVDAMINMINDTVSEQINNMFESITEHTLTKVGHFFFGVAVYEATK